MSSLLVVEACARGAHAGREVAIGDVARMADVTPSTASRLVDRAESKGLLIRAPSSVDARRTALHLTPEGAALQARSTRARVAWLSDRLAEWQADDVAALGTLLHRFADTFFDLPPAFEPSPDGVTDGGQDGRPDDQPPAHDSVIPAMAFREPSPRPMPG
ncbi:MarR family winged helix-turn-helix transcriptional regulator [Blastococcus brunescens]|uniref:MarR family transcriptional regulator n=1 Tax=Blastococcus brunescens TaxID=1564165 RepID=A0ABZ1B530_9ACTN|nr:MarR family transcriptional regulator [Blastococcus sp. BMG 8361]WRL65923.1 MarR family transcriptional regulator [Blastococcus sp. BMG 8361]